MVDRREILVGTAAAATSLLAAEAVAQPAATPGDQLYAVTYIEVAPAAADATRGLIAHYGESLKSKGALSVAVLQQIGRSNHFAIVEQWPSAKAREDNAASAASRG